MKLANYFDLKNIDSYEKLSFLLCFFLLVLLISLSHFHEMAAWGVETDFYGSYSHYATEMAAGERFRGTDHGPGYIFVLTVFYLIFGDVFVAGSFVSIISAVMLIFFSFQTIKVLFNSKLAFFTVLIMAIIIFPHSILASNDLFFSFIVTLSIFLIFRNGKVSFSNLLWGGIVSGYALMTRMNALILPLAIFVTVLIINPEKWAWEKRIKGLLIYGVCFLLAASPWFIMNYIYYGSPLASLEAHKTIGASMLGQESKSGDFAWGAQTAVIGEKYDSLFSLVFKNLPGFTKFFVKNMFGHFQKILTEILKFPAYLFFLPGVLLLFLKIDRRQLSYYSFAAFGFLIYCVLSFSPRFFLYVLVLFILPVVYFLFFQNYDENISLRQKLLVVNKVFLGVIILLLIKASVFEMKMNITTEPLYLIKAAEVFKKKSINSDIVFARKPHLAFLSDRKVELIPDVDSVENLIKAAQEKNVTFVFYGVKEAEARPQ